MKKGIFHNCIVIPFYAAIVCVALFAIFQLEPVRVALMRPVFLLLRYVKLRDSYYVIANTVAILPSMLFCCRSALKSKQSNKIILAVVFGILFSIGFGVGSNYAFPISEAIEQLGAWIYLFYLFFAWPVLIVFNLFFTKEYEESKQTREFVAQLQKEAEARANMAVFMSNPAARNQIANKAVAYKKDDGTKTIVKDAIIGGVVAGPAGAVVGAVVGKNKVDQDK